MQKIEPKEVIKILRKSSHPLALSISEDVQVHQLSGDASIRKYFRLTTHEQSYILCYDESDAKLRFLEMAHILNERKIRSPQVLIDGCEHNFILQTDLGDETLLFHLAGLGRNEELAIYKKAIDLMLQFHEIPHLPAYDKYFLYNYKFDIEKLMFEVNHSNKHLIQGFLKTPEVIESLEKSFLGICELLQLKRMVITHRDYHSRNLMFHHNELFVIDFQDTRWGLPQYDLVSLLEDSYYDINHNNKHDLTEYYWENCTEVTRKDYSSKDEFLYYYDLMAIQRIYKALGTFAYMFVEKEDPRYLKYIGKSFERLRILLEKYPEYKDLRVKLSRAYYVS